MHEMYFFIFQVFLIGVVTIALFQYVNSVATDMSFEKKYAALDAGLLMSVVQTAPGFTFHKFQAPHFEEINKDAKVQMYFRDSVVVVHELEEIQEFKGKFIQDRSLMNYLKNALFNFEEPIFYKAGNKVFVSDNSNQNLHQQLCSNTNTTFPEWRDEKTILLKKLGKVPEAKAIVSAVIDPSQMPSTLPGAPQQIATDNEIDQFLAQEAQKLGVEFVFFKALTIVEAGGKFFSSDGRIVIRMEPHVFNSRHLGPEFKKVKRDDAGSWGTSTINGRMIGGVSCQGGQENEYKCFEKAITINEKAAYLSISMGAPQIMGFNHKTAGYSSPQEMFKDFQASGLNQVKGFIKFVENYRTLLKSAQSKNFASFGQTYNGDTTGKYAAKLEKIYNQQKIKYSGGSAVATSTGGANSVSSGTVPTSALTTSIVNSISTSFSSFGGITGMATGDTEESGKEGNGGKKLEDLDPKDYVSHTSEDADNGELESDYSHVELTEEDIGESSLVGMSFVDLNGLPIDCTKGLYAEQTIDTTLKEKIEAKAFGSKKTLKQEIIESATTKGFHPAMLATFAQLETNLGKEDTCQKTYQKSMITKCGATSQNICSDGTNTDRAQLDCTMNETDFAYRTAISGQDLFGTPKYTKCDYFFKDLDPLKIWSCIFCSMKDNKLAKEAIGNCQNEDLPPEQCTVNCEYSSKVLSEYCSWSNYFGPEFKLNSEAQEEQIKTSTLITEEDIEKTQEVTTYFDKIIKLLTDDLNARYSINEQKPSIQIGIGGPGDGEVDKALKIFISAESKDIDSNRKLACLIINELMTPESEVEFTQIIPVATAKLGANNPLKFLDYARDVDSNSAGDQIDKSKLVGSESKVAVFIDLGRFAPSEVQPQQIAYAIDNAVSRYYGTKPKYQVDGFTIKAKYGLQDQIKSSPSSCQQASSKKLFLQYPAHPDYPEGRQGELGMVWLPKQTLCGGSFPLIIMLHGWRNSEKPNANLYLGEDSTHAFDLLAEVMINAGKIQPVIIAAPMDDPKNEQEMNKPYWKQDEYDVTTHVEKINEVLASDKITISSVSVLGHGSAICGGGVRRAVENIQNIDLSSSAGAGPTKAALYLVGLFDGGCNQLNYAQFVTESISSDKTIVSQFHNGLTTGDDSSADTLKGETSDNYLTQTIYSQNYQEAYKNKLKPWYTYKLKLKDQDISHTKVPEIGFAELLLAHFSLGQSVVTPKSTQTASISPSQGTPGTGGVDYSKTELPKFSSYSEFKKHFASLSTEQKIGLWGFGKARKETRYIVFHDGGGYALKTLIWDWAARSQKLDYLPECQSKPELSICQSRRVSSHYHIGCDGTLTALIPDHITAFHAGCNPSNPSCYFKSVNSKSIGIDFRNCKKSGGSPYTAEQHAAGKQLMQTLSTKYNLPLDDDHVVAHFEVGMHGDPSKGFNWAAVGLTDHRTNGYCCRHPTEQNCARYVSKAGGSSWSCA
ncbi:DUF3380 domain-containing protein [Candidatus Woesearchaeota archaeon]|nr:DUF3380 domain-containing protein [Candidatus Woesearchaeota archaeon]